MVKEEKKIITRESCKKELLGLAKSNLRSDLLLFFVMLLIFVPLGIGSVYIARYLLALGVAFALICAVGPIVFIYKVVLDIIMMRLASRGEFSVEKDTVSRLSAGEQRRFGEGRGIVDAIYFSRCGRYASPKSHFDMSSVGDEFYLVVLHNKKNKLVLAFPSLMYECNELDRLQ